MKLDGRKRTHQEQNPPKPRENEREKGINEEIMEGMTQKLANRISTPSLLR